MPKFSEISFRTKRASETELDYVEYKIRKVKQTIARQQWLLTHRNKIVELANKNRELQDEIMDYYLISLANGMIDDNSFNNLTEEVNKQEEKKVLKTLVKEIKK